MVLNSQTVIKIGIREIKDYKSLKISQEIASHHELELVIRLRNLEKESKNFVYDGSSAFSFESKKFLGEKISIDITTKAIGSGGLKFEGIITQIKNIKGTADFSKDEVVFIAKSPTVLLDDGPHFTSYANVSLTELIDQVTSPYSSVISDLKIAPMDDTQIYYSVQSGESSFAYLKRLAAQYGEWFYYNGKALVFGEPEEEVVTLKRSFDLKKFDILLNPISHNYKYFSNDYLSNSVHEKDSKEVSSGAGGYNSFVNDKAKEIYAFESKIWHNVGSEIEVQSALNKSIEKQKKSIEIQQVLLTGTSDNPNVKLGNVVLIEGNKYRITKITHSDSKSGMYENNFEGITAEYNSYPLSNIDAHPISQSQIAEVVENIDPEGLGRIKVRFPWQPNETSPWVRIVTPHAGSDKGFHFIPEIAESVLIDFEGGNAERPYMLGSLYQGSAKPDSWTTSSNDIKAIRTRSGHTIEFQDADGGESITITDKNSNIIFIDTANNNITITANNNINITASNDIAISAAENMTLSAKNLQISVDEDMSISVGNDLSTSVSENHNIIAKNKNVIVEETIVIDSKKQENLSDEITISSDKKNLTLISGKSVDVQSKEKVKLF